MTNGLGRHPFDDILSSPPAAGPPSGEGNSRAMPASKMRRTFDLPSELIERLRDAAWALSGPPHQLTLNQLATDALHREVERLEREHNECRPFPPRSGALRRGRRLGG